MSPCATSFHESFRRVTGRDLKYQTNLPWNPAGIIGRFVNSAMSRGLPWAFLVPLKSISASNVLAPTFHQGQPFSIVLLDGRIDFYMPFKDNEGNSNLDVCWIAWGLDMPPVSVVEISKMVRDREQANPRLAPGVVSNSGVELYQQVFAL